MTATLGCAILGSGNIGTDLLVKLGRSELLAPIGLVGIDPQSEGLARARAEGIEASADGIDWIVSNRDRIDLVFEATSAGAHRANAPVLAELGIQCLDLTPAKLGPGVVPVVNLADHHNAPDINMITCGGQATIPIVAAVSEVVGVDYAEIVATIASKSAGPGTRANIDEFTETTAGGVSQIGGARASKAIIVLNPAEPEVMMRNTVFCSLPDAADRDAIVASIERMAARIAEYVPGYRLRTAPVFDSDRVAVVVEVEGAGDHLPVYAGNLDIMTSAAVRVAEELARLRDAQEVAA
jgi:acetaldehyde dehydrogenase